MRETTFQIDKNQSIQQVTRNIFEYLRDFATNLETILNNTDSYKESTFGKNFLYSSFSLLESFINSLLMSCDWFDKQLLERFERWPLLDKCSFLYSIEKHEPFDRNILEPLLKPLRIRNTKTHPKPKEYPIFGVVKENESFSFKTNQQEIIIDKEQAIKIGRDLFKFLDRFLLDLCASLRTI